MRSMSAARKPHGAAKPDKTPAPPKAKAGPKVKDKNVPATRGRFNPLPHDEVGPRLLVKLQAEHVMKKVHLKEVWEGSEGWRFA
jgi:hypothetical protein